MIVVSDTTPLMHSPKVSELTDGGDYGGLYFLY